MTEQNNNGEAPNEKKQYSDASLNNMQRLAPKDVDPEANEAPLETVSQQPAPPPPSTTENEQQVPSGAATEVTPPTVAPDPAESESTDSQESK